MVHLKMASIGIRRFRLWNPMHDFR